MGGKFRWPFDARSLKPIDEARDSFRIATIVLTVFDKVLTQHFLLFRFDSAIAQQRLEKSRFEDPRNNLYEFLLDLFYT